MPPSCFWIEQGVGHFTGTMDQELEITLSAPWSTYPTIMIFQSPEVSGVLNFTIIDPGEFSDTPPFPVYQDSSSGAGINFEGLCTAKDGSMGLATIVVTNPGSGYEIGDIIIVRNGMMIKKAKLEVAPAHEASQMNLYVTDVTKTSFKVRTSTQYTSTSFHWRAIGKEW